MPSWDSSKGWRAPTSLVNWNAVVAWTPAFERLVEVGARALIEALKRWDERLCDLGGDPAREDWSTFRPLRLGREEDWSDWLGHLLATAKSGRFPARLFSENPSDAERWKVKEARREVVADEYRADLVVQFVNDDWAHLEVKVGDLNLAKTPATGDALQRYQLKKVRDNFLLLPEENISAWREELPRLGENAENIRILTWHDVARALRLSVAEAGSECLVWRAWAVTFLGAVEQVLLKYPPVTTTSRPSAADLARLEFLEKMEVS